MTRREQRPPDDFAAEIEAHLQHEADRLREEGIPAAEAEAMARRSFGNVTAARERFYEARRFIFMDRLMQDVRYAVRRLARSPVFTVAATLSLALGIGFNTAIYSFVNALMLRPYAFPGLDELVAISELHPQQGRQGVRPSDPGHPLATADFLDLRREAQSFRGLAAFRSGDFTLLGQGDPERLAGRRVSPEFFDLLGVEPALGRSFRPDEAQPGRDRVVVVSHALWQGRLGGAHDIVGRTLLLNELAHTVVGVMPAGFHYPPGGVELWAPLALSEADLEERGRLSVAVLGRLAPRVELAQARAELRTLGARLAQDYPRTNAGRSFKAVPLREAQAGLTAPFVSLFQIAALLVLVIACANVASMLLARGLGRRREMAMRVALGAGRGRLVRQLLTESLILSSLGLVLALGAASAGVRLIRNSVPLDITKWVAGWDAIRLDGSVLAAGVAIGLATALATGLAPAFATARLAQSDVLRQGGRGSAPGRGRSLIVVAQMALALVLLVGAALLLRGFGRLSDRYQGFEPSGLLSFRVRLPEARYPPGRKVADFYTRLLDELAAIPGVQSAGVVSQLPGDLGPVPGGAVSIRGRSAPGELDLPVADQQLVSPDYFRTLRVRRLAGRLFDPQDGPDGLPVAVVSESMAQRLWPDANPLGQYVKPGVPDASAPWREVVGVVEDVTQYWFDREPRSTLYLPQAQQPRPAAFVLIRAQADAAALAPVVRARAASLDPTLPLDELRTLRQVVGDGMAILDLAAKLLLLFGGMALVLSGLGVYGVIAQDAESRAPEIGVRLALGAGVNDVRGLVLGRALWLSGVALLIGVPTAVVLGRLMEARLFGVVRPDSLGLLILSGAILGVGLLAGLLPALRAARVDPASILRAE